MSQPEITKLHDMISALTERVEECESMIVKMIELAVPPAGNVKSHYDFIDRCLKLTEQSAARLNRRSKE